MTKPGFVPCGRAAMLVRVETYEGRCPKGKLTGPGSEEAVRFESLTELLLTMEERMDRANLPQRGEEPRAFVWREQSQPSGPGQAQRRALATFQISVLFRQNASWQGNILWVDRKMESRFRSVLELIRLMDSALSAGLE